MNGRTPWQAFEEGLPRAAKTNRRAEQEERKAAQLTPSRIAGAGAEVSGDHHLRTG